jgi:hypothetical protein
MGLLDDVLGAAVPGGNLAKPFDDRSDRASCRTRDRSGRPRKSFWRQRHSFAGLARYTGPERAARRPIRWPQAEMSRW